MMNDWIRLIRAEFSEIPGLRLTKRQAQRLWSLEPHVCEAALAKLESEKFLRRTPNGAYVRADT